MSAITAMPRSLDTWPTVAAPRAEVAESDVGHSIVLLGTGPFQDLSYIPLAINSCYEKQRITDTTASVFGGLGNVRVWDVLHCCNSNLLGSKVIFQCLVPFLF